MTWSFESIRFVLNNQFLRRPAGRQEVWAGVGDEGDPSPLYGEGSWGSAGAPPQEFNASCFKSQCGSRKDDAKVVATRGLQLLYGESVLPQELLSCYNHSISAPDHVTESVDRAEILRKMYQCVYNFCIIVEEKTIVSRFLTFGACVHTLLRYRMMALPDAVFSVSSIRPQPENQKRLNGFRQFNTSPECDQELRISSLSLQLTLHATSITAQKKDPEKEPVLVRLGKPEVRVKTSNHFALLLDRLHLDPVLDVGRSLISSMRTGAAILIRFAWYTGFPNRLWALTLEFNRAGHLVAIEWFLDVENLPDSSLGVGYSLPLRKEALCIGYSIFAQG